MPKFPVAAPLARVIAALEALCFRLVREGNHIAMQRSNPGPDFADRVATTINSTTDRIRDPDSVRIRCAPGCAAYDQYQPLLPTNRKEPAD